MYKISKQITARMLIAIACIFFGIAVIIIIMASVSFGDYQGLANGAAIILFFASFAVALYILFKIFGAATVVGVLKRDLRNFKKGRICYYGNINANNADDYYQTVLNKFIKNEGL